MLQVAEPNILVSNIGNGLIAGAIAVLGWQVKRIVSKVESGAAEIMKLRLMLSGEGSMQGLSQRLEDTCKKVETISETLNNWKLWRQRVNMRLTRRRQYPDDSRQGYDREDPIDPPVEENF